MQRGDFIGFYSTTESVMDGDSGFSVRKTYWQAWDGGPRAVSVQKLDQDFQPVGGVLPISRLEFEDDFMPEDDLAPAPRNLHQELGRYTQEETPKPAPRAAARGASAPRQGAAARPAPTRPAMRAPARQTVEEMEEEPFIPLRMADDPPPAFVRGAQADRPAANRPAPFPAAGSARTQGNRQAYEDADQSWQDEDDAQVPGSRGADPDGRDTARRRQQCARAEEKVWRMFARALEEHQRSGRGEADFEDIARMNVDWLPEYKHLFSRLAVALRKLKLYDQSLEYHEKAHALAPEDEHILFNMARAQYDMGDEAGAKAQLEAILNIDPDMDVARRFLDHIEMREQAGRTRQSSRQRAKDEPASERGEERRRSGATRVSDTMRRPATPAARQPAAGQRQSRMARKA